MLQDHPSVEDFQTFLRNVPRPNNAARNARVLRHLLAECPACRENLLSMGWKPERLERLVYLTGEAAPESTLQASGGYNYDRAFAKADEAVAQFLVPAPLPAVPPQELLAELDRHPLADQVSLVERDERFASPGLVQWLIDRSHAKRYTDPDEMLHWSRVARSTATRSSPESVGGAVKLADLQARAWGQFGNALRVTGRMREAEEALSTAQRHLEAGTGDPALRAKVFEQIASLHTFQRRFDAAIAVLTEATEIYRHLGESHALARTLVQEAIAKLYSGEAENAVVILNQAIPLIDQEGDPHLLFAACHNLVQCYINLDQPEQALSIYSEMRDLYKEFSDPLLLLRTAWQEGHLLRDLGHLQAAEGALLRARTGFLKMDLMYEAAVVSLDLAAIYVKLRAVESCKQTVAETIPIFRALGVVRETFASLLQLQQVADQEQQALEIIRMLNARIEPHAKRNLLK
jgi:tetratricopeptide (TPR) repeat protein